MIVQMQRLIALLHFSKYSKIMPTSVLFATNRAMFTSGLQQDCSEYLGHLLNLLHEHEKVMGWLWPSNATGSSINWVESLDLLLPYSNKMSIADRSFSGQLSNIYKCLTCSYESSNPNSFRELQLAFPEGKINQKSRKPNFTVQGLLDLYCTPEILDGDNKYACPQCAKHCKGERQIKITEAPLNIIITIKRFNYNRETQLRTKLLHKIIHDDMVSGLL